MSSLKMDLQKVIFEIEFSVKSIKYIRLKIWNISFIKRNIFGLLDHLQVMELRLKRTAIQRDIVRLFLWRTGRVPDKVESSLVERTLYTKSSDFCCSSLRFLLFYTLQARESGKAGNSALGEELTDSKVSCPPVRCLKVLIWHVETFCE